MKQITRLQFKQAIAGGIERAGDLLTSDEIARLADVAMTAKAADANFHDVGNGGCPATQAGLTGTDDGFLSARVAFGYGYDDALRDILGNPYGHEWHDGVKVID